MKLPNGYGSVTKLSGNRRKPYVARVTTGWRYDEKTDRMIQERKPIGTFRTKKEALRALAEYNHTPYDLNNHNITLETLYHEWHKSHYKGDMDSSSAVMDSAWKYCHSLYKLKFREIRPRHIKHAMDNGYFEKNGEVRKASPVMKTKIKSLFNMLFDYAIEYDIVSVNYARNFEISSDIHKEIVSLKKDHIAFTDAEIQILWDNVGTVPYTDWVLIQCYSGWRPKELCELKVSDINLDKNFMSGGMKTESGKNRIVPIHPRIKQLIIQNMTTAEQLNSPNLINDPDTRGHSVRVTYSKYSTRFAKVISQLKLNSDHRPHDPRKTFITMAKQANMDEYVIKRIVGHKISDITENLYTDRDSNWMLNEITKIP